MNEAYYFGPDIQLGFVKIVYVRPLQRMSEGLDQLFFSEIILRPTRRLAIVMVKLVN